MSDRPHVVLYVAPHPDIGHPSGQLMRLRTWSQVTGAQVVEEIADEATTEMIRPGLLSALEQVRTGAADTVAVIDARVIHPDEAGQEAYASEVRWYGGRVQALTPPEQTDTRAMIQAYQQVRERWHRAETVSRLNSGRRAAREDPARFAGGRIPLGRKSIGGRLVEEVQEMAPVARIRELRRVGRGYTDIARILSAEQYVTKEGKTTWHAEQVKRVVIRHGDDDQPAGAPDARTPRR